METGTQIPLIETIPKPRWSFRTASWSTFASALDANIRWIPPQKTNYTCRIRVILWTAKKHVPSGYLTYYIPGLRDKTDSLYVQYLDSKDPLVADELLDLLNNVRMEKWRYILIEHQYFYINLEIHDRSGYNSPAYKGYLKDHIWQIHNYRNQVKITTTEIIHTNLWSLLEPIHLWGNK